MITRTLLMCLLLFSFSACRERVVVGRGAAEIKTRSLESTAFSNIKIAAPVNARITVGPAASLTFEGYANILPYLRTEVRDNTLRIFTEEQTGFSLKENITATITLPALTGLDISGAGDAVVTGIINVPRFTLDMSGAGSVEIQELHVQSFDADLSGASDLTLRRGDIKDASYDIAGQGNINAFGVSHRAADLEIAGAGDVEITVTDKLNADISGAGSIKYKGHPAITQDISGAGNVVDAN